MIETKGKKGIIYCRVSSSEQVDGTSLDSQERVCGEYASKLGIEVVKVFVEKGESAKTANRTEFQKAIALCCTKKGNIDYFIVYKVDRFSRNQDDHAMVRVNLKRYGTELRSATEPINETPTGRLMESMMAGFAEFDNSNRAERCKGGMMEKVKQGTWVWQAPLGYYRPYQASNLAQDPIVAPYIALAFEEYAKGTYTYRSLAKYLYERGLKTRQGKAPSMQLMEKMLKSPLYCGRIQMWGLDVKGNFEPIVSEELFAKCQKGYKRKYQKISRSIENPEFPLRKICICPDCGTSLTGSTSRGGSGGTYSYYHHHKQLCPRAKSIPKDIFEQLFVKYLDEITPNSKYEKILKAVVMDVWQSNYKKFDENNARVRKEIEILEVERQKIFDLYTAGKYSDEEFSEQKSITNSKIEKKHLLIQVNRIEEFDMEEALDYCFNFVRQTSKTWTRLKDKNYGHLVRFQNQIFPEKINFNGEKFGTDDLSLIYKMNQDFGGNKSQLVDIVVKSWNQIESYIFDTYRVLEQYQNM